MAEEIASVMSIPSNQPAASDLYVPDLMAVVRVAAHDFASARLYPPAYFSAVVR